MNTAATTTSSDLTRVTFGYRCRVWLAMLGLLLFVAVYVGLAGWFTWTTYRMVTAMLAGGDGAGRAFFVAVPAAFLAVFMWKALFFIRQGKDDPGLEITAADQPELFAFLRDLADEVHAPHPHRVFLSPNVNACVFYDLSILNFFVPSKKNLLIGLGLVNALTRSEFRAVLAHEFGHFAQRSMAVGRWVYVGEQIAAHIIAKRDVLDRVLDFVSRIDLRVAWIGWIMRTIVWSIRSLMEGVFRWVILAHRALTREMEFHADLVAVSATGSDALVHALYKTQTADEDWERSLGFANQQFAKGRVVTDIFAVQSLMTQQMRRVLSEPRHGLIPTPKAETPAEERLFTEQIATPPRMWSTHPPNTEREANAKRVYLPAPLDSESAWTLFENPESLRTSVTQLLLKDAKLDEKHSSMSTEEVHAALDEQFAHESVNTAYQGAYLGRYVTIGRSRAEELYSDPLAPSEVGGALAALYPSSLHDSLTSWRNLNEEIAHLEAIEAGVAEASSGVIRHRGEVIRPSRLSELIKQVKQERDDVLSDIEDHDRQCRTAHLAAARSVDAGWGDYLVSLGRLLHYVEHSEADLNDAHGQLANVTMMATAAGRVSSAKLERILRAADDLHTVMTRLDGQAEQVKLPPDVLHELEAASWREALPKLELPAANRQIIGQWLDVVDSWVIPMSNAFGALRRAVLDELLRSERYVAQLAQSGGERRSAPSPAVAPSQYAKRQRGNERKRQTQLDWWSRFTLADGALPAALRFGVAASIVAAVITAGMLVGSVTLVIYNGLATSVVVHVNDQTVSMGPFQHRTMSFESRRRCSVSTQTSDGREVEAFEESLSKPFASYVYNVAGAAPMIEWTAVYGQRSQPDPDILGFPRWRTTAAVHLFTDPPQQISTSGSGGSRLVLSSDAEIHPGQALQLARDDSDRQRLIRMHAIFDAADSRHVLSWLTFARDLDDFDDILAQRLQADPGDIVALRMQQDSAAPGDRDAVLARHRTLAAEHPDDPNWTYLAIRSMPDGPNQDQAFVDALQRWPDNAWLANASGYAHTLRGAWQDALDCYSVALRRHGPWYNGAAMQVARIRRLLADDNPPNLSDLAGAIELQQMLDLESGQNFYGTPMAAYSMLNQNQVAEAFRAAGGSDAEQHILVLLAASVGASDAWQDQVLRIPIDEIQDTRLDLYLAALAYRLGRSAEPYLEHFEERYPKGNRSPAEAVRTMMETKGPGVTLDELDGLDPLGRGLVTTAAIIMFPDQVDEDRRRDARALLFAPERPAF